MIATDSQAGRSTPLRVLVVESEPGVADAAAEELRAAGHEVVRCHERGAPVFPCNALADDRRCPLDEAPVDAALDVRSGVGPAPTAWEDGFACAIRRRIPTVVTGAAGPGAFETFSVTVASGQGVVDACEEAAAAPLPAHAAIAERVLHSYGDGEALGTATASVRVTRRHGELLVEVRGASEAAPRATLAARITGALRAHDRHARAIDVVFHGS
jgi:hypothetical protein